MQTPLGLQAYKIVKAFENTVQSVSNYGTMEEHVYNLMGNEEFGTRPFAIEMLYMAFSLLYPIRNSVGYCMKKWDHIVIKCL